MTVIMLFRHDRLAKSVWLPHVLRAQMPYARSVPAISDFCFFVISHAKEVKYDPFLHMITVRSVDGVQVPRLALAQFSFTSHLFLKWEKSGAHHPDGLLEKCNLVKHSSSWVEYKGFNVEGELINLIRAWDKKIWVPDRNWTNRISLTPAGLSIGTDLRELMERNVTNWRTVIGVLHTAGVSTLFHVLSSWSIHNVAGFLWTRNFQILIRSSLKSHSKGKA